MFLLALGNPDYSFLVAKQGIHNLKELKAAMEGKLKVLDAIRLLKDYNTNENIPDILNGDYQIVYRFDTQSFLNYYNKVFTYVALERITGINQKLLHHYATGLKKPREPQRKKIETALHKLGSELLALEL